MHIWTKLAIFRHSKKKEGVDSEERSLKLFFLPLDYFGEMYSILPCLNLEVSVDARVDFGE